MGLAHYAALFMALYLVAHIVARRTVPNADPYLLPMAALLTAVGLTEIYRLDPDDAFRQALWIVIGVALFAATLICAAPRLPACSSRYKYLFGVAAIVLLFLPRVPGSARRSTARGSGCTWAVPVPAGRAREDRADRLPRGVPAREARGAGAGAAQGLRAAAPDLGRARCSSSSSRTTSARRSSTSGSSWRCSTSRRRGSRTCSAASSSSRRRRDRRTTQIGHVRERVTVWLQPWTTSRSSARRRAGSRSGRTARATRS